MLYWIIIREENWTVKKLQIEKKKIQGWMRKNIEQLDHLGKSSGIEESLLLNDH